MAVKNLHAIETEFITINKSRIYHGYFDREKLELNYSEVIIFENGSVKKRMKAEGKREYKEGFLDMFYPKHKLHTKGIEDCLILRSRKND